MSKCVQCALNNADLEHQRHPNDYTLQVLRYQQKRRKSLKTQVLRERYLCPKHAPEDEHGTAQYKPDNGPVPVKVRKPQPAVTTERKDDEPCQKKSA